MSGKKLSGKPKLPKVSTYMVARFRTFNLAQCLLPILLNADSRKAFCEICSNAIIAKHCELERHNW